MPKLNSDDGAVFFLEYQLWAITVKIWVFILKYILLAIKWLHHHPEVSLWILVSWAGRHGYFFFSIFYNFWSPESRLIEKFVMSIVVSQTEFIKTEIYFFYIFKRKLIAADCEGVKFFLSEDHLLQLKLMWIFYKMIELIRVFLHFRPIVPIKLPKLIKGNVNPLLLPPSKFISLKIFVTECTDLSQNP